jgi:predicted acetyltransferase
MSDADLPVRAGTPDDWAGVSRLMAQVFHQVYDPDSRTVEQGTYEPERALLAVDGDAVVGHAAAFTRDLSVPGDVVPAAHVTLVGVAPTHRRRRLLTRMMHRQLHEIRAAGREAVAVLWASEGRIYPRFGYGLAARKLDLEISTREVRLAETPAVGRLRAVDPATSWTELAKVYEQLRAERPGWSSRDERWWRYVLADTPAHRYGATELRAVVHEGPHGVDGYAVWRTKGGWEASGPNAEVYVREVAATDTPAYLALWRFLLNIDLTRTVRYHYATVDEPLQHLVDEPRRLGARFGDSLWVRLVDVPTALAARRYAAPVDAVLEVTDPLLPDNTGRWHLTGDPRGGSCRRTDAPADLACEVRDLGAAYLGGTSLASLATAGRVRELRGGTLPQVSTAFGWHRPPSAVEVF